MMIERGSSGHICLNSGEKEEVLISGSLTSVFTESMIGGISQQRSQSLCTEKEKLRRISIMSERETQKISKCVALLRTVHIQAVYPQKAPCK
jgi:hypothetical protein